MTMTEVYPPMFLQYFFFFSEQTSRTFVQQLLLDISGMTFLSQLYKRKTNQKKLMFQKALLHYYLTQL